MFSFDTRPKQQIIEMFLFSEIEYIPLSNP